MAEPLDGLFAIEVDADDYAETAAADTPVVSRTHQSEADFQAQRDAYSAHDSNSSNYELLLRAVPSLQTACNNASLIERADSDPARLTRLDKKTRQLLGYAVGELYYDGQYDNLMLLCKRVRSVCETDAKLSESLRTWMLRWHEDRCAVPSTNIKHAKSDRLPRPG
ncbi:hypothetical protein LTR53_015097 [Teratosphaeriaceae sp. CCFEE 6253]|nr:hypothetical protein LTR53_015097 [Teratosphaeriaceae sp. CCFEE 6253]